MPALDSCHQQVVRALEKEGWTVASENEYYRYGTRSIYVDLRIERVINSRVETMLLAEVKYFDDKQHYSTDLYTAIGQYLIYHEMLRALNMKISIYLVIPNQIYDTIFDDIVRTIITKNQIQ